MTRGEPTADRPTDEPAEPARCGAPTRSGRPCRNRVPHPGARCHLHQTAEADTEPEPAPEPPPTEPPPAAEPPPAGDPRLERAAARCADALAAGALDAVDQFALPYLGETGWVQLRSAWRLENCRLVAPVTRQALDSPARLHDAAGQLAGQVWTWLGRPRFEQIMVRELVKRLPILGEGQVRPLARAAQLVAIRLCHERSGDLTTCACFADLVTREGERRPRQLLEAASGGWPALARLR